MWSLLLLLLLLLAVLPPQTMVYLDHKTLADAAFVVSRMVKPASMSAGWLQLFAQVGNIPVCAAESHTGTDVKLVQTDLACWRLFYESSSSWSGLGSCRGVWAGHSNFSSW